MGFKSAPAQCPICKKKFLTEWGIKKRLKRDPCCSKQCDMERRYGQARDEKYKKALIKQLTVSGQKS